MRRSRGECLDEVTRRERTLTHIQRAKASEEALSARQVRHLVGRKGRGEDRIKVAAVHRLTVEYELAGGVSREHVRIGGYLQEQFGCLVAHLRM